MPKTNDNEPPERMTALTRLPSAGCDRGGNSAC
jgi:hypothetical protein